MEIVSVYARQAQQVMLNTVLPVQSALCILFGLFSGSGFYCPCLLPFPEGQQPTKMVGLVFNKAVCSFLKRTNLMCVYAVQAKWGSALEQPDA